MDEWRSDESPKHQHTRRALAAAAIAEAERVGVAHVTVADIARAAGVSRRTFFRHFSTKSDVFLSCVGAGSGACFDVRYLRGGASWNVIRRACVERTRGLLLEPRRARLVHAWVDADASLHAAYLTSRDRQVRELILALTASAPSAGLFGTDFALAARCAVAAVETAFERWLQNPGADAAALVRMIITDLDRLERGFGSFDTDGQ